MRHHISAGIPALLLVPGVLMIGGFRGGTVAAPAASARPASAAADTYLGLSINELRARLGNPDAIAGYELFSWFSPSKEFPPDQWNAVSGRYMARADVYYRKNANDRLKYEFLLRPDIRQSREHPTLRVTEYSITFEKPVMLRDVPRVFTELSAVAAAPATAYEGRATARYNRNSLVVQAETEATAAIAHGFWEDEEPERGDPGRTVPRYGPQYQLWFAGDIGLYAATGETRVERLTVGVGPIGLPARDDRNRPGEIRELRTLGAFFSK